MIANGVTITVSDGTNRHRYDNVDVVMEDGCIFISRNGTNIAWYTSGDTLKVTFY